MWQRMTAVLVVFGLLVVVVSEAVRQSEKLKGIAVGTGHLPSQTAIKKSESSDIKVNLFTDISDQVGLNFVQTVGPLGTHFMPEINGSGGAMFDYDSDGDLDLFFVNLGKSPRAAQDFDPEVDTSHRLYRQETDGKFTDQTEACGMANTRLVGVTQLGIGCAVGDVNNDGFSDLYLANYGSDQLFINREGREFVDCTSMSNLGCTEWGTAAAFFDYDRDGWLDLIVVNYCADTVFGHSVACGFVDGTLSYCGPQKFEPTIDRLYHNDGARSLKDGIPQFTDVTEAAGLGGVRSYGLGLAVCDFDGDAWPDFFIANDMRENRLWMNQRDGTFSEEAAIRGVAMNGDGVSQGCMGVSAADLDQDSDFDLVVTNLVTEGSVLYENNGNGTFNDSSRAFNVIQQTKQHTGWGVALVDLDLDGDLDMPVVNGFVVPGGSMFPPHGEDQFQSRVLEPTRPEIFFDRYVDVNLLLMNNSKNQFVDMSASAGDFTKRNNSNRALILGDIDNDGDIDLLTTSVGARARLFRNEMPRLGHWLKISCSLPREKRIAIGAVVRVHAGNQTWTGQIMPSSSYLASNDPAVHFGLGQTTRIDRIEVIWPDGTRERFAGTGVDKHLRFEQSQASTNISIERN